MSIVGLHIHFHIDGDCLRLLSKWLIDIGRTASAATTISGSHKRIQQRSHEAAQMLATFTAALSEQQRADLHEAFDDMLNAQRRLQKAIKQKKKNFRKSCFVSKIIMRQRSTLMLISRQLLT